MSFGMRQIGKFVNRFKKRSVCWVWLLCLQLQENCDNQHIDYDWIPRLNTGGQYSIKNIQASPALCTFVRVMK